MLGLMQNDWSHVNEGPEYDIMRKFADNGQKYGTLYLSK